LEDHIMLFPLSFRGWGGNHRSGPRLKPAARRRAFVPRLDSLECRCLPSTFTVVSPADSGVGTLRNAVALAASGDTIAFDPSLSGQAITLTSGELRVTKALRIAGPGPDQLAVSGGFLSRVFEVAGGAELTLTGLTVTQGEANFGAGLLNHGTLVVENAAVTDNLAVGTPGAPADRLPGAGPSASAEGGGIWSDFGAVLRVSSSTISGNLALALAGYASGGGVENYGKADLTDTTIDSNQAVGGPGGTAEALGGGVQNFGVGTTLVVSGSTVSNNQAIASAGNGAGGVSTGDAFGGGLQNLSGSTLVVVNSTVVGNQAIGGSGGAGGFTFGGGIDDTGASLTVTGSTVADNAAVGGANTVFGGGLNVSSGATATVADSTFSGNQALAGPGKEADGGGIAVSASGNFNGGPDTSSLTLSASTLSGNVAAGGAGASGGLAVGGALSGSRGSSVTVGDSTFTFNQALGGNSTISAAGGLGGGFGGAAANASGQWTITGSVFTGNQAIGGSNSSSNPNSFGASCGGGGLFDAGATTVLGSTFTGNQALGGSSQSGTGGEADGGAIEGLTGSLTVSSCVVSGNQAVGGDGPTGGNARGGGVFDAFGSLTVLGSTTVTGNSATGGGGSTLGAGTGGGLYIFSNVRISRQSTIAGNTASTSDPDIHGTYTLI
jgi:hypothetical protein